MTRVTLKGTVTKVSEVDVQVPLHEVIQHASGLMTVTDILHLLMNRLSDKFRKDDPEMKDHNIDFHNHRWEKFSYYDHHHGEDVYETVRSFNDAEMLATSMMFDIIRQLQ